MPKLAASIVVYNTPDEELKTCLDSICAGNLFCRIYVIDNSRASHTRELCRRYRNVSWTGTDNRGYGAGNNIALHRSIDSGMDYHLVLNPDISFSPETIPALIGYMDANPDIGAVQPKIVGTDGTPQYTVRMLPTPFDLIIRRFIPSFIFKSRRNRYELRHIDHSVPFNVPYHQGSFMFLRTAALREIGIFDERFFMYPEDIDLTRRIHTRYRTMFYPYATVVHAHRAESYKSLRMLRIHIRNMILYFNKWGWFFDSERKKANRTLLTTIPHTH